MFQCKIIFTSIYFLQGYVNIVPKLKGTNSELEFFLHDCFLENLTVPLGKVSYSMCEQKRQMSSYSADKSYEYLR